MAPFGSKQEAVGRLSVLTRDYLVEGTAEFSGQNFIRLIHLTEMTMRAVTGTAVPAPRGTSWSIGEDFGEVIGLVPLDQVAYQEVSERATRGNKELAADIYTGPYVVRGTVLAFDDDPKVLAQARGLAVRDAVIECLAPGSTLGSWQVPLVLVYLNHLQGIVLAA